MALGKETLIEVVTEPVTSGWFTGEYKKDGLRQKSKYKTSITIEVEYTHTTQLEDPINSKGDPVKDADRFHAVVKFPFNSGSFKGFVEDHTHALAKEELEEKILNSIGNEFFIRNRNE
jgi:hypothetical protein